MQQTIQNTMCISYIKQVNPIAYAYLIEPYNMLSSKK